MFLGQIGDSASSFHDILSSSDHLTYVKVLCLYSLLCRVSVNTK